MQEMELRGHPRLFRAVAPPAASPRPVLFQQPHGKMDRHRHDALGGLSVYPTATATLFSRENAFMHHRWIWKKFHYRIPYPWREPRRGGEVMIQKLTEMKTTNK